MVPVDLLVVGGDITTGGTSDDAARAVGNWGALAPHMRALAGNMDSQAIDARLVDLGVGLDARGVRYDDVGVFGVSASPLSPLHTPYELLDDELEWRVASGFPGRRPESRPLVQADDQASASPRPPPSPSAAWPNSCGKNGKGRRWLGFGRVHSLERNRRNQAI